MIFVQFNTATGRRFFCLGYEIENVLRPTYHGISRGEMIFTPERREGIEWQEMRELGFTHNGHDLLEGGWPHEWEKREKLMDSYSNEELIVTAWQTLGNYEYEFNVRGIPVGICMWADG
jgi:hypothetical protein